METITKDVIDRIVKELHREGYVVHEGMKIVVNENGGCEKCKQIRTDMSSKSKFLCAVCLNYAYSCNPYEMMHLDVMCNKKKDQLISTYLIPREDYIEVAEPNDHSITLYTGVRIVLEWDDRIIFPANMIKNLKNIVREGFNQTFSLDAARHYIENAVNYGEMKMTIFQDGL